MAFNNIKQLNIKDFKLILEATWTRSKAEFLWGTTTMFLKSLSRRQNDGAHLFLPQGSRPDERAIVFSVATGSPMRE